MMEAYSCDPMGDGHGLSDYAKENLISGLSEHPTTIVFLALDNKTPCGIATCFRGFSTFAAKPLINISDFFVEPRLRGKGIGNQLLFAIENEARRIGCCKLSLEVQENNPVARGIYTRFGFQQAVYAADSDGGGSQYMVKQLT
ncbi:Spermine/spermidine acetyltransferase [Stieleria varia]|uniref:Spermine/spermidine acetyltransferase n=2 Tax=Stieleria varia TaxID=2528005 RepID=A0A5C6B2Y8_9BACT|nr:Spermine/spermidine acetyltransferase [Stieleria varia]